MQLLQIRSNHGSKPPFSQPLLQVPELPWPPTLAFWTKQAKGNPEEKAWVFPVPNPYKGKTPPRKGKENLRWPRRFEARIGAIRAKSQMCESNSQLPTFITTTFRRLARIASSLRFASLVPRNALHKKGVQFGNFARIKRFARICESIRATRAI